MISYSNLRPQRTSPRDLYTPESTDDVSATVLTQSKKIAKHQRNAKVSSPASDSRKQKGVKGVNETYSHEERENIVSSIRLKVLSRLGKDLNAEELETFDYVLYLKKLTPEVFDILIADVIPQYKPELVLDKTKLGQLRKKIRGWFATRQNTNATQGKRSAMLENEIRELNQIAVGAPGYNYGNKAATNEYALRMEDMYAKAPIVFEPNMYYNNYWANANKDYGNNSYYYYPEPQSQGNMSVGDMIEYNGLTTRSNSPLGSPVSPREETQGSIISSHPYMPSWDEFEQDWAKYKDDLSAGFWNSAKNLYTFGERLGL